MLLLNSILLVSSLPFHSLAVLLWVQILHIPDVLVSWELGLHPIYIYILHPMINKPFCQHAMIYMYVRIRFILGLLCGIGLAMTSYQMEILRKLAPQNRLNDRLARRYTVLV
jgi:hypothetical protein